MTQSTQSSTQDNRTPEPGSVPERSRCLRGLTALAILGGLLAAASQCNAQATYPSPAAAAEALQQTLATSDINGLRKVLGADYRQFIPVGSIGTEDVYAFLSAYAKHHEIVDDGKGTAHLQAGESGWTLPVPIRQTSAGWHFDLRAGRDEMTTRRIGRDELAAIQTVLAIGDAQRDFAKAKGETVYAQRFISNPGKQDGLYWPTAEGEPESPLGELAAVMGPTVQPGQGYHGYRYRILTAQGPGAPGGARNYLNGTLMTGGYAVIAWPVKYGETGVMTFISGSDGKVYQQNLGPKSSSAAARIQRYDPTGWQGVPDSQITGQ
ncbi:hypothetical protein B0G76_5858 [Paraburkholderia sp. BL23I1N1]|uniref:DUF2950 domain-containing protein n=1 Tax=Paraburkholderia sp. BL23I1N1 TaxID=1938802 RepID=UPI000FF30BB2|nr:DUF2950 domain-containing protein [Paraburkholderia sp. BL23I1N1]RKE39437.1 hypothetical protein B0G76_5858 [Paraburkholderia sp. BL23I1N1]